MFDRTIAEAPGIDLELADALYSIMHRQWDVYDDVLPVLEPAQQGRRVAMLSNVGFDLTPTLERTGVGALIDGAVMSYAVGVVKPDPGIFQRSLEVLDLPASEVLMVGDAWRDDAGAAALGVRTYPAPDRRPLPRPGRSSASCDLRRCGCEDGTVLDLALAQQAACRASVEPKPGDRFVLPPEMEDEVFILSNVIADVHRFENGNIIGFNGTTEWALDSVEQDDVVWLPRKAATCSVPPSYGSSSTVGMR